ncbi:TetR/AcrR family transcriptional regulator [Blastococcus mobilis]|uniref:Transcriptional regulator, TetR family n=1 Tax=Blastococcus mobilis TaxID=1938746 RepID=A0A238XPL4_9ACTN|nr:TetR/AcrR family transcriptional regulator C-terminal domain-containing protein [Blastococcus mobilis]SNR60966.1 transcriptional regulator, TetR family [Blastococcus mobilis]
MTDRAEAARRTPLSRERVLRTAVALADESGLASVSMRGLAQELGVVPMALYKHVANKDQLLDGMVDLVLGEIDPPDPGLDWKSAVRQRILSARGALLRHPWARRAMEAQAAPTPVVMGYLDATIGIFLGGGMSVDLTHHVMHALGSRVFGFTQELHQDGHISDPDELAAMAQQLAALFPNVVTIATYRAHDGQSVVGTGCDDQFEFEFALDLMLDGFERLHRQGWSSPGRSGAGAVAGD